MAWLGLTLSGARLARTAITAAAHLRAIRRHAIEHSQAARLVGQRDPVLGAVLVDHAQPADDAAIADRDARPLATALVVLAARPAPRLGLPRPPPTWCSGSSGCSLRPSH